MCLLSGTPHMSVTAELTARVKEGTGLIVPGAMLKDMDLGTRKT